VIVERLLKIALLGSSWVLYMLLGLSVVSLTAALERWLFFRRHRDDQDELRRKVAESLGADDLSEAERILLASPSVEAGVVRTGLRWVHGGPEAVADAIAAEMAPTRQKLERGTTLLGTLGNNAPFVGLLGTVIGVIEAFHQLGNAGQNQGAMGNVMAGIAEALVATGVGLFVALPAVVAYNIVEKQIGDIETGVEALSKLITAFVKTREKQLELLESAEANGDEHHHPKNGATVRRAREIAKLLPRSGAELQGD
jgi:biopolymer transport protein ExbB/TolQ